MSDFSPQDVPLVFMGTPDFSAQVFRALLAAGFPVRAVVTRPDAPLGRGRKSARSPVKATAMAQGIATLEPLRLDADFVGRLQILNARMFVVVAYGKILPLNVLSLPPLGCINVHPSLLPRYRGPAPINWALINGESVSGVSIMRLDAGIDTGDVVLQREYPILPTDDCGSLTLRFAKKAATLLPEAIELIATGRANYIKQDDALATPAPPLSRETCLIDWSLPAAKIVNLIRGLSPRPAAYTLVDGRRWNIYTASFDSVEHGEPCGRILPLTARGLPIAAPDGLVYLHEVQMENKRRMPVRELLNGYKITDAAVALPASLPR